jgi:hypothetical protein
MSQTFHPLADESSDHHERSAGSSFKDISHFAAVIEAETLVSEGQLVSDVKAVL